MTDSTHPSQNSESLWQQVKGFPGLFWTANWMELIERFSYYGLRTVVPIYMVLAFEEGGPQFTHIEKASIFAYWALLQSFIPVFTGGFADRFGYKLNIVIATFVKIAGYLVMGYAIRIAAVMNNGDLTGVEGNINSTAGGEYTYWVFFAGAMLLAAGTAIFKPGLQGMVAKIMPKSRASTGWGIFYQMVNVGAFLGPLLAGPLRLMSWEYVFLACAAAIALNFIPLFFFSEPERSAEEQDNSGIMESLIKSFKGLFEPRLFAFTILFSGFWLMFFQLFDILPNFIDDWVDSREIGAMLQGTFGGIVPINPDGNLGQEWMININALLISLLAFLMGYLTGKVKSLHAMILGIGVSCVAIWMLGMSMDGWWCLFAIGVFSLGEMAASPTRLRYLANIAPPGRSGAYMGYANATVGIGWFFGSLIAGNWYENGGDKVNLAKTYLVENLGQTQSAVDALKKTQVVDRLVELSPNLNDAWGAQKLLWDTYHPYEMWTYFALIGVSSMVGLMVFNYVTQKQDAAKAKASS
jgi:dipeptide/tripeptide permease